MRRAFVAGFVTMLRRDQSGPGKDSGIVGSARFVARGYLGIVPRPSRSLKFSGQKNPVSLTLAGGRLEPATRLEQVTLCGAIIYSSCAYCFGPVHGRLQVCTVGAHPSAGSL